jgi:hypothetical protein
MQRISYIWNAGDHSHVFDLAFVRGTQGHPYSFGEQAAGRPVEVRDFFIDIVPITQALGAHIMDADDKAEARNGDAARFNRLPRPARRQEWSGRPEFLLRSECLPLTGTHAKPELSRVAHHHPALVGGDVVAGY